MEIIEEKYLNIGQYFKKKFGNDFQKKRFLLFQQKTADEGLGPELEKKKENT